MNHAHLQLSQDSINQVYTNQLCIADGKSIITHSVLPMATYNPAKWISMQGCLWCDVMAVFSWAENTHCMPVNKERWDVDLWLFKVSFLTEVFSFFILFDLDSNRGTETYSLFQIYKICMLSFLKPYTDLTRTDNGRSINNTTPSQHGRLRLP